jgi:hypothetical protein
MTSLLSIVHWQDYVAWAGGIASLNQELAHLHETIQAIALHTQVLGEIVTAQEQAIEILREAVLVTQGNAHQDVVMMMSRIIRKVVSRD